MAIEPEERELIAELARGAVRSAAPQEAALFRATSDAYFKDPEKTLRGKSAREGMLGFGAGEVVQLITPIALALAARRCNSWSQSFARTSENRVQPASRRWLGHSPDAYGQLRPGRLLVLPRLRLLPLPPSQRLRPPLCR